MKAIYPLITTIIFIGLQYSAYAQENFQAGYIVNLNGDTISGAIDYRQWAVNPTTISFKARNGNINKFSPIEILSFHTGNEHYFSGIVQAEKSGQTTQNLSTKPDFIFETDTAFLRSLILGPKSLFQYIDKEGRLNFYYKEKDEFILLRHKVYRAHNGDMYVKKHVNHFIGQLINYFSNWESIHSSAKNLKYQDRSLLNLYKAFYEEKEAEIIFISEAPKPKTNYAVTAGVAKSSISNFAPLIGLSLEFVIPRSFEKWSLSNDILYFHHNTEVQEEKNVMGRYTHTTTSSTENAVQLSHLIKYHNKSGFPFFINTGLVHAYTFNKSINTYTYSVFGPTSYEEETTEYVKDKYKTGIAVGTGLTIDRFAIEGRYATTFKTFQVLCRYQLGKQN